MGGFFGIVSARPCIADLFYGVDYHSHLGTKRAGIVTYNKDMKLFRRSIHNIENAYFRNKFGDELGKFVGTSGIGVISDTDAQPIVVNSHLGRFAISTVGKINNIAELEKECLDCNQQFTELSSGNTNPTELVALMITRRHDFVEGIQYVYSKVKGSCSILILTEDGLIAARDYYGRTPIVIGKDDSGHVVASENHSFANLNYQTVHYIGPGEIVKITADSYQQLLAPNDKMQICSFLWIYYGYPSVNYEDINVENTRYRNGYAMGKSDDVDADFVSAIPDSGIGMALGYATVFCDDSIVRGTQLRDNVRKMYEYGAKEVHIRISCPPLLYGCEFLNFSASKTQMELITRRVIEELEGDPNKNLHRYMDSTSKEYANMVEILRRHLGVDTLKFNTLDMITDAIGLPKERICTHCFDGSSFGL